MLVLGPFYFSMMTNLCLLEQAYPASQSAAQLLVSCPKENSAICSQRTPLARCDKTAGSFRSQRRAASACTSVVERSPGLRLVRQDAVRCATRYTSLSDAEPVYTATATTTRYANSATYRCGCCSRACITSPCVPLVISSRCAAVYLSFRQALDAMIIMMHQCAPRGRL